MLPHFLIDRDQKIDGPPGSEVNGIKKVPQFRTHGFGDQIGLGREFLFVSERELFRVRFQKEIERVDDRHLRDEIHLDVEVLHRIWKHDPCEAIALRILLPVDEIAARLNFQRISCQLVREWGAGALESLAAKARPGRQGCTAEP